MLTHYNSNSFDANPDNLFHCERIRPEVLADVDVARRGDCGASGESGAGGSP